MKLLKRLNFHHDVREGVHFLWFTWFNGEHYFVSWECQGPVWWLPKGEKYDGAFRLGWLVFSVAVGGRPK